MGRRIPKFEYQPAQGALFLKIGLMTIYQDTRLQELLKAGLLSVRAYNCLHHAKMETISDVTRWARKPTDLLKLRNLGKKSYAEITGVLASVADGQTSGRDIAAEEYDALSEGQRSIIADAYTAMTAGEDAAATYLRGKFSRPADLHDFAIRESSDPLAIVEGMTREENIEVRRAYKRYVAAVVTRLKAGGDTESNVYTEYASKSGMLAFNMEQFTREQVARYFLPKATAELIGREYQAMGDRMLSARGRNFRKRFLPHFADILKYSDAPIKEYKSICPGQNMAKTIAEIFQFNKEFSKAFDEMSALTPDEVRKEMLKLDYAFLSEERRSFVSDFIKEHGHVPMYYLLRSYLLQSASRADQAFCMVYGISDGRRHTVAEVANSMQLTSERIRQLLWAALNVRNSELLQNKGWHHYAGMLSQPYLHELSADYQRIRDEEQLPADFGVFARLTTLISDFAIYSVDGHAVMVNGKQLGGVDIKKCLARLTAAVGAKRATSECIPISPITEGVPEEKAATVGKLISDMAMVAYNAMTTADGKIFCQQNYVDIADELYDILARHGSPMHVDDIFREFKKRYPAHKFTYPLQIKSYLFKHPHIRSVGKTSRYALDSWQGIYFGSIRALLIEQLEASSIPVKLDDLTASVNRYFPGTGRASINATLRSDLLHRFTEFEGSRFGLSKKTYPEEYKPGSDSSRLSFDKRISLYEKFLIDNKRFPSFNTPGDEASMQRWCYNVMKRKVDTTDEERARLAELLDKYYRMGYPRTSTEAVFRERCDEMRRYAAEHHCMPSHLSMPGAYSWFHSTMAKYPRYKGHYRQYFEKLLDDLRAMGIDPKRRRNKRKDS